MNLPPLVGTLADLPENVKSCIEAYGKAAQSMAVAADRAQWAEYLKDGQTPFERFMQERKDLDALMGLYGKAVAAADLMPELKAMYKAYVRLLETARDRLSDLGYQCDSLEKMERDDPYLIACRKAIAAVPSGEK